MLACLSNVLNGISLREDQREDLLKCLMLKNNVVTYATGMGKTVLACAILRCLVNEVGSRRFIFVIGNSQIATTIPDVEEYTGLKVGLCTGEASSQWKVLIKEGLEKYQVLFVTYSFFDNIDAVWYLYNNMNLFYGIVIDEAHTMSNFRDSKRALALRGLLTKVKMRLALTATPATTEIAQYVNLLHMFFPTITDDVDMMTQLLIDKRIKISEVYEDMVINRDRAVPTNYIPKVHFTNPTREQVTIRGSETPIVIKGPGAYNNLDKLKEVISNHVASGKKGLVYIAHKRVFEWVREELTKDGFNFTYINGEVNDYFERGKRVEEFNDDKYDFMIISITTALNLDCDFLVLYENCPDIIQFLGRGDRGMNPKSINLDFIFTKHTREIKYFVETQAKRMPVLQNILQKDYSAILDAARQVENELNSF